MKTRFQVLKDPCFSLVHNVSQRFTDGPVPQEVRLARAGFELLPYVKKKAVVDVGTCIAVHPSEGKGNLFSPIRGEITEINERYVIINARDLGEKAAEIPPSDLPDAKNLDTLEGQELLLALKKLGVDTAKLSRACDTLIINALNPEPGIMWAEPMLATHVRNLKAGFELHQRFSQAKEVIIAVPKGVNVAYQDVKVAHIDPWYPNSVDELVTAAVTGQEKPEGVGIVGLHKLWGLGRVAITQGPLMEGVITVSNQGHSENYIIKDGTRVSDLLAHAGMQVNPGDTVVVGGPLRGQSISQLDRGIDRKTLGLFVIAEGPPLEAKSACCNCGQCVLICPARLNPNTLSRYAEFALYEKCKDEYIDVCLECGLCGYVCQSRRPVLQYIRLAKTKLEV